MGCLDLIPGDPGFAERHPEMSRLYGTLGAGPWWRLPLGATRPMLDPLDAALRQYAGGRAGGVVDVASLHQ